MRHDPTIALARALAVAPVVAGKWTVQADADVPQEVRGWIDKQFLTVREPFLETILKHGYVDFSHSSTTTAAWPACGSGTWPCQAANAMLVSFPGESTMDRHAETASGLLPADRP
jgi:hypothetical protein